MTATRLNPKPWEETSGSWTIRHFEDGTGRVEARKEFTVSDVAWSAWGTVYEARIIAEGTYPVTFRSNPSVTVAITSHSHAYLCIEPGGMTSSPTTRHTNYYVTRPNNPSTNFSGKAVLYATGIPT